MWALGTVAGSALWTIDTSPQQPAYAVVDMRAGRAVFSGFDGVVSVVDTRSGQVVRHVRAGGAGRNSSLAVAVRAGHTFVISQGIQSIHGYPAAPSTVSMVDTRTGAPLRAVSLGIEATTAAVDERSGHVFVTVVGATRFDDTPVGAGSVSMLDAQTGALVRTVKVGRRPVATAVDAQTARVFVANGDSNTVSVLDARSGTVIRTVPVRRTPQAIAVDEKTGRVFIANSGDGSISVLDARTGALMRTVPVGLYDDAMAVDTRAGRVLVTSLGAVSVLDATTGSVLRTFSVGGSPYAIGVDARTSRAFVTGTDGGVWAAIHHVAPGQPPEWAGYVAVLDTQHVTLLRTVRVGRDPRGIAVDEQAGHAFVANYWSSSVSVLDATR